jgi:hypothetical protein
MGVLNLKWGKENGKVYGKSMFRINLPFSKGESGGPWIVTSQWNRLYLGFASIPLK